MKYCLVKNGIPRSWMIIIYTTPNIFLKGSRIPEVIINQGFEHCSCVIGFSTWPKSHWIVTFGYIFPTFFDILDIKIMIGQSQTAAWSKPPLFLHNAVRYLSGLILPIFPSSLWCPTFISYTPWYFRCFKPIQNANETTVSAGFHQHASFTHHVCASLTHHFCWWNHHFCFTNSPFLAVSTQHFRYPYRPGSLGPNWVVAPRSPCAAVASSPWAWSVS